jgi:uncharacterized protein (TIGR02757 family)
MNTILNKTLEDLYKVYHKPEYMRLDPVEFVHGFSDSCDIETVGLLASSLAYGKVEIIRSSIGKILSVMGKSPHDFILSTSFDRKKKLFYGFKHRFNDGDDIALLFESVKSACKTSGSLKNLFLSGVGDDDKTIRNALNSFTAKLRTLAATITGTPASSFMQLLPLPESGSACKRLNMYLRWMVRKKDGIDFGVWKEAGAKRLVMPVDTHVAAISRSLGLTKRNSVSWLMAEEITENLKKIDPDDPVKYDFSLCRSGMVNFRSGNV